MLPCAHRLFFLGLLTEADRLGRTLDRPVRLKLRLMPVDDVDVYQIMTDLHNAGLIVRYQIDGKAYLNIPNFLTYQRPHPREAQSVIPPPPFEGKPQKPDKASLGPTKVVQLQSGSSGSSGSSVCVPTHTAAGVLSGTLPRDHRRHAWCGRKCVPDFLHGEFVTAIGGDPADADRRLRGHNLASGWYADIEAGLPSGPIGDEPLKFWRGHFAAAFPSGQPVPSVKTEQRSNVPGVDKTAAYLRKQRESS